MSLCVQIRVHISSSTRIFFALQSITYSWIWRATVLPRFRCSWMMWIVWSKLKEGRRRKEIERNGLATFSERQFSVCEEKYFLGVRCRSVFVSNLPTSLCLFVSFPRFSAVLRFVLPTAALPPSSFCFPAPTRPHPRPVVLCTHSHSIHQLAAPISSSNLCVQISLSQSANFRMAPAPRSSRYFPFLYLSLLPPPFVSISDQFYHFCHPFVYLSPDRLIDFRRFHFLFVMNLFSSDFSSLQI